MLVPRQSYIKRIDADGTWPFEDVRAQVRADAIRYFNLVLDPTSVKGRAEAHLQVREMHNGSNGVIGSNVVMKIGSNGSN